MAPYRVLREEGLRLGRTELSARELSRAEVMGRVKAGNLGLVEASELLELSYRQAKRILARYRRGGAKALQHGNCGRASNRAYGKEFRASVLARVRERYGDFGPTLAAEHLGSDDGLPVAAETLRRWMKQAGLWRGQRRRQAYRQRREPKAHFGELVQLDGSFHDWLEERGPRACLMHMADDALFEPRTQKHCTIKAYNWRKARLRPAPLRITPLLFCLGHQHMTP
jgi:transposase